MDLQPGCDVFHANPATIAHVRRRLLREEAGAALAETFKVLGDLTRVRILDALAQAELCVCDLATLLGLTESAVSHQLRLLRGSRVVRARRDGRMVFYALDDQHVVGLLEQGLRHVEEGVPGVAARREAPRPRAPARASAGSRTAARPVRP
jgi:DNA-binding transcriptional ArsR family regulator